VTATGGNQQRRAVSRETSRGRGKRRRHGFLLVAVGGPVIGEHNGGYQSSRRAGLCAGAPRGESRSLPPIPHLPIKLSARICGTGLRCRIRVLASSWIFLSGLVIVTAWLHVLCVLANFRGCQFVIGITVMMLGVEFPVVCRRFSIPIVPKSTVPELLDVCFRRISSTPSSKDVLRHGGVAFLHMYFIKRK
jgi:hypothetical protein